MEMETVVSCAVYGELDECKYCVHFLGSNKVKCALVKFISPCEMGDPCGPIRLSGPDLAAGQCTGFRCEGLVLVE